MKRKGNSAQGQNARAALEAVGVDLGPLRSKESADSHPTLHVPSPMAATETEAAWLGHHLKPVLSSAREEGERLLGTVDLLAKRLFPARPGETLSLFDTAPARRTEDEERALASLETARTGVQGAWGNLVAALETAVENRQLAASVVTMLEDYYREAVAGLQTLRDDPSWRALWPSDTGDEAGRGGPEAASSPAFPIQTSQEMDVLLRSICDGHRGSFWSSNTQAGMRVYERPGLSHSVRLALQDDEKRAGLDINVLERLTLAQDADAVFVILYVSRLLAPPAPLPANLRAGAWVSADDIIEKIGWDPRSSEERRQMRRRVWDYLRFGARASVMGRRSSKYRDPRTGEEIDTFIDGPAWAFMKEEKPIQPSLFADDDVPLRVELVMSREWTRFTSSPLFAQYLPLGEVLGAIRPDKPSGAWARVLGLALASFWRRNPRAALDGTLQPTRRELLDHYPPKVAPPTEVLGGPHPRRALEYWCAALAILAEAGYVEKSGEALRLAREMREALPRYNWRDGWLDERVSLRPGPAMRDSVQATANSQPLTPPRSYKALPPAKKRGRPRKAVTPAQSGYDRK